MSIPAPLHAVTAAALRQPGRGVPEVPGVWQGRSWAVAAPQRTRPTGHAALDAQLPGGGWPLGAMAELLLPAQAAQAWPIVLPGLALAVAQGEPGRVVLVAPPHKPFAPALQAAGLPAQRLCVVLPGTCQAAEASWASEQALRCRDVLAVLAWLPQARPEMLRRLQLAAAQQGRWLWVLRPEALRAQASPAPLRLWAQRADADLLRVQVIKRRGPPLLEPVLLPLRPPALPAALDAQAHRQQQAREDAGRLLQARRQPVHAAPFSTLPSGLLHALGRTAPARG